MRTVVALVLALAAALLALACDRTYGVLILDVQVSRAPDKKVVADVELEAVEQGGRGVGPYCVSIHWFNFGFDPATPDSAFYPGERDKVEQCANDLSDGDQRIYRLISNKTDLEPSLPARVQVQQGKVIRSKGAVFAP